jgi:Ca-activated chloride channel family protein
MILTDFHFLYPLWFLLLPVLAGFVWWLKQSHDSTAQWNDFIDEKLRPYILSTGSGEKNKTFMMSIAFAGLIATFALAGPSWDKRSVPAFQTQQGLVVAMDLSTSMILDDITPSRLVRSRFKLIDLLKLRQEGQTGLVVFAGAAFAVSPLTDDTNNIIEQVKHLGPGIMPSQGSRIDLAIDEAVQLLKQSDFKKGNILLITDGLADLEKTLERAEKAKQEGYKISILAVGTTRGATIPLAGGRVYTKSDGSPIIASLDEEQLQQVVKAGGGYYKLSELSDNDVAYFNQQFSPKKDQQFNPDIADKKDREVEYWNNAGIYLSLLLIPFVLLLFRRGVLFSVALAFLLLPQTETANAYEWDALWKNDNQLGQTALENKQADKAVKLFKRSDWQAAAAYRNEDYKKASTLYSQFDTADAYYNQANALARQGQYDKAIEAYNQALSKNSKLQDAMDNKALIEQLKKQQGKDQKKDQDNKDNKQDDKQDQSKQKNKQQDNKNNIKDDKGEQEQQSDTKNQQKEESERKEKEDKDKQQQDQKKEATKDKKDDAEGVKDPKQHGRQGKESEQSKKEKQAEQKSDEEVRKIREENQRTDQWLRKIPDDSAALWRRKFMYQYRRRSDARGRGNQQPW